MAGEILKFEAAATWLDGVSLAGHISEIEKPEMAWDTTDHEALALRGVQQFPQRMQALECTLTFADYTTELAKAAANPFQAHTLQIREAYGVYLNGSRVRTADNIITLRGRFISSSMGSITQGEMERECMMAVDYVKEVNRGEIISEFSVNPPIWRAGGVDIFEGLRSILGV